MLKTTTNPSKLSRELSEGDKQMSAYYEQVCALPDTMASTLPFGHESYIITRLYDDVLGKLCGKVILDHAKLGGKDYYRFTICVLNRKHTFVLTPLSAYMQAQVIVTLQRMGMMEHLMYEGVNTVYIPTWARRLVYDMCRDIYKEHKAEVNGHVAMLESFHEGTGDENVSAPLH